MMHMNDERVERRASLDFKNFSHRIGIQGIRPQAVNGFRGNPHQSTRRQRFSRADIQLAVV